MIIKMVNEFKLTVVHFARPNPMQICACARIYRWTKRLWKIRTGPPGRWASGPRGCRGPWAAGRWAFGPLGRRGPWAAGRWAAGLLSAKPRSDLLLKRKISLERGRKTARENQRRGSRLLALLSGNKAPWQSANVCQRPDRAGERECSGASS